VIEVKKEKVFDGEKNWKIEKKFENINLKKFFSENFSDSKILQKNFYKKIKNFIWNEKIWKKDFSHLKLSFFIEKISKKFPEKIFLSEKISSENFKMNIKNFDEIFEICEEKISDKKNFSEINIFLENEKKYLEITNCDLFLDFWNEKEKISITLQSDEFLKMID